MKVKREKEKGKGCDERGREGIQDGGLKWLRELIKGKVKVVSQEYERFKRKEKGRKDLMATGKCKIEELNRRRQ